VDRADEDRGDDCCIGNAAPLNSVALLLAQSALTHVPSGRNVACAQALGHVAGAAIMARKRTRAKRVAKKRAQKRTARKGKVSARERTRPVGTSRVTKKKTARRKRGVSTRASSGVTARLRKRAADAIALTNAARALQGRRIVVAFADNLEVPQTRGFKDKKGDWETLRKMGAKSLAPIFTDVDMVNRLEEESRQVRADVPRYRNTFMLELKRSSNTNAVLKVLRGWRNEIRLAYEDREPVLATDGPSALLCNTRSGHLEAAPEGVHASAAWAFQGGQGELQVCVDVEIAWAKHHRLKHPGRVDQLCGGDVPAGLAHGTMVLGILCGSRSRGGSQGIVPEIADIRLASHAPATFGNLVVRPNVTSTPYTVENLYDAVMHAINHLKAKPPVVPGSVRGVLLIEYQTPDKGLPIEILPMLQELIGSARDVNVCVVEAAGNGARDLDQEPDVIDGSTFPLRRRACDSGAIVVGSSFAAFARNPATNVDEHVRFPTSNFGSRVCCYAWGEQIRAPTFVSVPPPLPPTECEDFAETSGAAAIIAGVALQLLGIAAAHGVRLDVQTLREILCNPDRGTPATPGAGIGSMPDLKKILAHFQNKFGVQLG
jgi:hypothetical protein